MHCQLVAAAVVFAMVGTSRVVAAQTEVGASLVDFSVAFSQSEGSTNTVLGVPSGSNLFATVGSGLYASFFATPRVAVEPHVTLIVDSNTLPVIVGGGGGYRWRLGDRPVTRVEARFTHTTEGAGNAIGAAVLIGGLFGH
jgi:hypothetical protein